MDRQVKATVSPAIFLCGTSVFDTSVMYGVGEGRVLCDVSREDKLLDCLIILFCVHYTYNFDYKVQRSAMMFLEKATFGMNLHDGQIPLDVSQIFTLLGQ